MAVKMPHAEMIVSGTVFAFEEKNDYETKAVTGYRASLVGQGGAVAVNFGVDDAVPFCPIGEPVFWYVRPGEYEIAGSAESRAAKGMSVRYVREFQEQHALSLLAALEEQAKRHPVKA